MDSCQQWVAGIGRVYTLFLFLISQLTAASTNSIFIVQVTYIETKGTQRNQHISQFREDRESKRDTTSYATSVSDEGQHWNELIHELTRRRREYMVRRMMNDVSEASRIRGIITTRNYLKNRPREDTNGGGTVASDRKNERTQMAIGIRKSGRYGGGMSKYMKRYKIEDEEIQGKKGLVRRRPISTIPGDLEKGSLMGEREYG